MAGIKKSSMGAPSSLAVGDAKDCIDLIAFYNRQNDVFSGKQRILIALYIYSASHNLCIYPLHVKVKSIFTII